MEELNLKAIWQESEADANRYYAGLRAEVVALARQKSASAIAKIRRNIVVEAIVGLSLCAVLAWAVLQYELLPVFSLSIITVATLASCIPYYWLWRKMRGIHESSIVNALRRQIQVLRSYIFHVVQLVTWLIPLGYFLGFFYGAHIANPEADIMSKVLSWKLWMVSVPLCIITAWVINFIVKKYMHATVGKYVEELEHLRADLERENHPAAW